MKNEMSMMKMDERQRLCWLYANRTLVFIIGLVWIGLIIWDIANKRVPYFMIAMVPVFALTRFILYQIYNRRFNL